MTREELVALLQGINPRQFRPYGTVLFEALARWMPPVAFEMVALRRNGDDVEVFMTLRRPDESYADQWHSPGSVMRYGEQEEDVFRRLAESEFGTNDLGQPVLVGVFNNTTEERGHFYCPVYLCQIGATSMGRWFRVDDLPANTVRHHREKIIPIALRAFNQR